MIEEQKMINEQPECVQYRTGEIDKFKEGFVKFVSGKLNDQFSIILKNGYTIFVGGVQNTYYSFLKYQGQEVLNYNWENKNSESVRSVVPVSCTGESLTFFNGDIAQISSKDEKPCLKKI